MFSHGSLERFFKKHGVKWDPISDFRYQSLNVTFLAPLTANRRFQMNFQQPEDCFAATVLQFSIVDWVSPTSLKKYEGSTFGNFKTNKSLKGGTYTPTSRGVAIRNACLDLMTESTESIQNHLLFYPKTEKKKPDTFHVPKMLVWCKMPWTVMSTCRAQLTSGRPNMSRNQEGSANKITAFIISPMCRLSITGITGDWLP